MSTLSHPLRTLKSLLRHARRYVWGVEGIRHISVLRLWFRLRLRAVGLVRHLQATRMAVAREVRVYCYPHRAFRRLWKALSRARNAVVVHMFIWKDDATGQALAELLCSLADRGVMVEVVKDTTGDVFELNRDFASTRVSGNAVWKKFWNHPAIGIRLVTGDNHSKVFLIDGEILFLTGMNIADEYPESSWDYLVELRGRHFVAEFLEAVPAAHGTIELLLNRGTALRQVRPALEALIANAERSIVVQPCYFDDARIIDLLAKSTQRGVRVTLILPEKNDVYSNVNLSSVAKLLEAAHRQNVGVWMLPGFAHGKMMFVDGNTVAVGSANMMASSLDSMGEAHVIIRRHRGVAELMRLHVWRMLSSAMPLRGAPKITLLRRLWARIGL